MIDGHGLHRFAREHEVACIAVRNSDAVEHEVIAQIVGMTQRANVLGLESTSGDIHGIWPFLESGRGVARRRHRSCFCPTSGIPWREDDREAADLVARPASITRGMTII
ncbi:MULTISPECIES: hypothetical protein [Bradyrhizobium]|uniref:hypothetical protein n=1 Tax=Bradyrhizobium TaxID=374 RepID=UPI00131C8E83|nr:MULTISPECIES: hypothetical protein [Bradyrhizobium]UFW46032.1 hypothetical protein BaraCB756_27380 [Bradyrhizobium arachidis]